MNRKGPRINNRRFLGELKLCIRFYKRLKVRNRRFRRKRPPVGAHGGEKREEVDKTKKRVEASK